MDVDYRGEEELVIKWLHENIQYGTLSPSGRSGFDKFNGGILFGVYTSKPRVFFKNEKDAILFALRWL